MKIPNWFLVGCGLLVLNIVLVLGGVVSRHASAVPPDETAKSQQDFLRSPPLNDVSTENATPSSPGDVSLTVPAEESLPKVPSLDTQSQASSVLTLDDFKEFYGTTPSNNELLAPLDAMRDELPAVISDQLSHNFFDSVRLRLQSTERLNQAALGLVEEAAILFQRGEVKSAKELLRTATLLREMTAKMLVTHQ